MKKSSRVEVACAWSGVAFLISYLLFFAVIARWVPPMSPHASAAHVAATFHEHAARIRIGQLGAMVCSFLLFPLWALISAYIARVERSRGRPPVLAMIQFGCAVLLQVFFVLCSMIWLIATFRTGVSDQTLQLLNDAAWLIFVMVFPGYVLQMGCIAIAAFSDPDPDPIVPRWAAWFHLWVGISGSGGGIAVFFKQGPFAWNGAIGFWLPITIFAAWLVIITGLLHRAATTGRLGLAAYPLSPAGGAQAP